MNTTTSKATIVTKHAPPIDRWISNLTNAIQKTILGNDWQVLKLIENIFAQKYVSQPNALKFDNSDLFTARTRGREIINFSSPVPNSYSPSPAPTISAGIKPPRIEIPKWSGKSYEFYTWITACSRTFEITQCHETIRTQMMISAMSLEKTTQFNNITN